MNNAARSVVLCESSHSCGPLLLKPRAADGRVEHWFCADIHCLGPPSEVLAHALQALHGRHESDNCVMERRFLRAKRRLERPVLEERDVREVVVPLEVGVVRAPPHGEWPARVSEDPREVAQSPRQDVVQELPLLSLEVLTPVHVHEWIAHEELLGCVEERLALGPLQRVGGQEARHEVRAIPTDGRLLCDELSVAHVEHGELAKRDKTLALDLGPRLVELLLYGNVHVGNSTVLQDHSTGLGFRPHGEVDQPQGPGCRHRRTHANEPRLVT
mmetsp:Transcript_4354/g.13208  ORF Transcript_4354/g.13208 Transcript_4354/m.13208 type:complete len:272 (+) Transcript_4354:194-1009(+)